ncbi:MAG: hypothetical protein R3Y44_06630 [Rikenellaceae bacterium]
MNKIKHILPLLIVALLGVAHTASGQLYEQIEERNIWNESANVTGLLRDSITVSNAELSYSYQAGEFADFSDASSQWSAGASAKTITHTDNLSMIGAFSFSHTAGKEMSGSMFISPNYYPVDILEFTPGDKTLQNYYFMGGLASEILPNLNLGLKGEFQSQNYAKFKDLRHYNYRMDLTFAPSISYNIGDGVIGASYLYIKNSETVRAQEIGSASEPYSAFLDKGLMRGAYENWEGSGVHLSESGITGFPVSQSGSGVAAQVEYRGFFGEIEYRHLEGSIGEKQTIWYEFPSNRYTARLGYTLLRSGNIHIFSINANIHHLINCENILDDVTSNGVTTTVIYGSNQIYETSEYALTPKYLLFHNSGAQIEIGANYYNSQSQSTLMYPYVNELSLSQIQAYAGGMLPVGKFELRGKLLYSDGTWSDDAYSVSDQIEAGDEPTQMEEYYNIENEYLTATYINCSLSARYNAFGNFYCEVGGALTNAFNLKYIEGNSRWSCTFKLGYNF